MTRQHKTLLLMSILFFVCFASYTYIVHLDILTGADRHSTIQLQKWIPKAIDPFLSFFSLLGSFEVLTILLTIILVLRKKIHGVAVLGIYLFTQVIEVMGKTYINHPGPPYEFFRYDLDFLFPSTNLQTGSAYPSGHSMRSIFLVIILSYILWRNHQLSQFKKWFFQGILILISIIMLISRVSLGEHWTTDVIGGALLAGAAAFFSLLFL